MSGKAASSARAGVCRNGATARRGLWRAFAAKRGDREGYRDHGTRVCGRPVARGGGRGRVRRSGHSVASAARGETRHPPGGRSGRRGAPLRLQRQRGDVRVLRERPRAASRAVEGSPRDDHEPQGRASARPRPSSAADGSLGRRRAGVVLPRRGAQDLAGAGHAAPARRGRVPGRLGACGGGRGRAHGRVRAHAGEPRRRLCRQERVHPAAEGRDFGGRGGGGGAASRGPGPRVEDGGSGRLGGA